MHPRNHPRGCPVCPVHQLLQATTGIRVWCFIVRRIGSLSPWGDEVGWLLVCSSSPCPSTKELWFIFLLVQVVSLMTERLEHCQAQLYGWHTAAADLVHRRQLCRLERERTVEESRTQELRLEAFIDACRVALEKNRPTDHLASLDKSLGDVETFMKSLVRSLKNWSASLSFSPKS